MLFIVLIIKLFNYNTLTAYKFIEGPFQIFIILIKMDNNSTKKYLHIEKISFSWIDYFLFTFIIIISVIVGIYFGCFGKKQKNANEYLLGGKKMKLFPIAISLVAR